MAFPQTPLEAVTHPLREIFLVLCQGSSRHMTKEPELFGQDAGDLVGPETCANCPALRECKVRDIYRVER